MSEPAFAVAALTDFAAALFRAAGLDEGKARTVAELLVEADLMGHTTHGLALAPAYLGELASGAMAAAGEPETVADTCVVATWDGRRLPGVWLTAKAVDLCCARAKQHGMAAVAIRRAHHIACLAAFLPRATGRGMVVQILSSDPSAASVAPFGGTRAVFTPDPLAFGFPTDGDPVLIDTSAAITTNGMSNRLLAEGRRFAHRWLLTADGEPTDDPRVFTDDPPGTILPTGGLDHGHKGYGLALMIEALTQGLPGFGRADPAEGWGASVWVQVVDPERCAGLAAFVRQMAWTVAACRASPPRVAGEAVRLPGQAALARRRQALVEGVRLYPGVMAALAREAQRLGVEVPWG
mgnify:CR=1 FL=1